MKKRVIASLSLLERDYRPCRGGNYPLVPMKERAFSGSLEASAEDNEP